MGPSHQKCGSFLSAKDLLKWYVEVAVGRGGSPFTACDPSLDLAKADKHCKHTKRAISCDQPGKAETSAHDMGGTVASLDSVKWDTHVGNTLQMPLSTTLCNARHACCSKAICLLPGFHPDKYIYQGPLWVREHFTVSPTQIILESFVLREYRQI